jgi:hypothetical protein
MKKLPQINSFRLLLPLLLLVHFRQIPMAQEDSIVAEPVVRLHYYTINNSQQYLLLESMMKKGKTQTPQKNKSYSLFLDSSSAETLIATTVTDANGKAKVFIPVALKDLWNSKPRHVFIVKEGDEEVLTDFSITKAKMSMDTSSADGIRSITVSVQKQSEEGWIPAAEVEMEIGFSRLGGILPAGEDATYTTDSSGTVSVEVTKDSLPGDSKGNIILSAKVKDHEEIGNLLLEKNAAWGIPQQTDNSFFTKRTLWSARFRTPVWLLVIAYGIVISVWGTLIYLLVQLLKIRKLGKLSPGGEAR